jgi:hypothetical protein
MKQIKYLVDVTDNPMVKVSDQTKTYLVDIKEKHLMIMRNWVVFRGVPYCDYFNPEENYTVVSLPMQPINPALPYKKDMASHKCAFRISVYMIFHKKVPLFQGKIEKGAVEKGVEAFNLWTQWAGTKTDEYRQTHPLPKPKALPPQEAAPKRKETRAEPVVQGASQEQVDELKRTLSTFDKKLTDLSARLELSESKLEQKSKLLTGLLLALLFLTILFRFK